MLLNPQAEQFFATRSAHDEVGTALIEALKRLGEYELRGDLARYRSPYAVTANLVFCGATGMGDTYWRLRAADRDIAVASGAQAATVIGEDWVQITLFRANWPRPDLAHWALRAYDYARTGS